MWYHFAGNNFHCFQQNLNVIYFQKLYQTHVPRSKGVHAMKKTTSQQLIEYVSNLTPQQVDKIIDRLPKLLAEDEELSRLFRLALNEQKQ